MCCGWGWGWVCGCPAMLGTQDVRNLGCCVSMFRHKHTRLLLMGRNGWPTHTEADGVGRGRDKRRQESTRLLPRHSCWRGMSETAADADAGYVTSSALLPTKSIPDQHVWVRALPSCDGLPPLPLPQSVAAEDYIGAALPGRWRPLPVPLPLFLASMFASTGRIPLLPPRGPSLPLHRAPRSIFHCCPQAPPRSPIGSFLAAY